MPSGVASGRVKALGQAFLPPRPSRAVKWAPGRGGTAGPAHSSALVPWGRQGAPSSVKRLGPTLLRGSRSPRAGFIVGPNNHASQRWLLGIGQSLGDTNAVSL